MFKKLKWFIVGVIVIVVIVGLFLFAFAKKENIPEDEPVVTDESFGVQDIKNKETDIEETADVTVEPVKEESSGLEDAGMESNNEVSSEVVEETTRDYRAEMVERVEGYKAELEEITPDPDDYYEESSEVVEKIKIKDSEHVMSEKEVSELLYGRGLYGEITTEYDMEDVYSMPHAISWDSDEKHPMYDLQLLIEGDEGEEDYVRSPWLVCVIDDSIMALPLAYNMEYLDKAPVV